MVQMDEPKLEDRGKPLAEVMQALVVLEPVSKCFVLARNW